MSLGMAGGIDEAETGNDLITAFDHFYPVFDRCVVAACASYMACTIRWQSAGRIVAGPEIPFRAGDVECCVRNRQLIELVDRAPKMIGMAMRENHFSDLRFVDAGSFEIVPKFSGSRHELVALSPYRRESNRCPSG